MTEIKYTPLTEAVGVKPNASVVYISSLADEIAKRKQEKEAAILKEWDDLFTVDYIKEKIVKAEVNGSKTAVLLQKYDDVTYLADLFKRSGTERRVRALLDPSTTLRVHGYGFFEVRIDWDASCVIL